MDSHLPAGTFSQLSTDHERECWKFQYESGECNSSNLIDAQVALEAFPDGGLLLAYNNASQPNQRTPLSLAASCEDLAIWDDAAVLEDDPAGSFSYPTLLCPAQADYCYTIYTVNANLTGTRPSAQRAGEHNFNDEAGSIFKDRSRTNNLAIGAAQDHDDDCGNASCWQSESEGLLWSKGARPVACAKDCLLAIAHDHLECPRRGCASLLQMSGAAERHEDGRNADGVSKRDNQTVAVRADHPADDLACKGTAASSPALIHNMSDASRRLGALQKCLARITVLHAASSCTGNLKTKHSLRWFRWLACSNCSKIAASLTRQLQQLVRQLPFTYKAAEPAAAAHLNHSVKDADDVQAWGWTALGMKIAIVSRDLDR